MTTQEFTLGEMAHAAEMTPRNVRAYQTRGLLLPPRRRGRQVVYGADHLGRLRLVRALHERGLSLGAISSMIERGTAEAELNRMVREDLSGEADRVHVHMPLLEESRRDYPEILEHILEVGLATESPDGLLAEAAMLSLINAAYHRGVPGHQVVRLCVLAARTGMDLQPQVREHLPDSVPGDTDLDEIMCQLAAAAFVRGLGLAMRQDGSHPQPLSTPLPGADPAAGSDADRTRTS